MSTASLPSYWPRPSLDRTPSYTEHPQAFECRLAVNNGLSLHSRPSGDFVKVSRNKGVRLRLIAQEDNIELPVYGSGGVVEGTVELSKTDGVSSVEVKIEGRLHLQEVAEGGTHTSKLCLDNAVLWTRSGENGTCPPELSFSLSLPTTFTVDSGTYPLPPTYEVHLSGVPGFRAWIDYSVATTVVHKSHLPKVNLFGLSIGTLTVSTPFIYLPRTRPAVALPHPMPKSSNPDDFGVFEAPEWRLFESIIRSKSPRVTDVLTKLYVPASRVFCISQAIPFHLIFHSPAQSLAAFSPFLPLTGQVSFNRRATYIQVMRQSAVDVRHALTIGTKTDMWKTEPIGEGSFKHFGDGPSWVSFSGEITINKDIKVGGFKAAGLAVKDCIVLTMRPLDLPKAPFADMRLVIPIRMTTDGWMDGIGAGLDAEEYSPAPSKPGERMEGFAY